MLTGKYLPVPHIARDRIDQKVRRVSEYVRPLAQYVVYVIVSIYVVEVRALSTLEEQRHGRLGHPDVAADASSERILGALV